jgi:dTDP-4-dehydrorhamnose reductase
LRIAWLYGAGGPSFVHTMLKLGAQSGDPLKVVDDQIGNPTSTTAVAERIRLMLGTDLTGTFHCTCEGEATWYAFTQAIFQRMGFERGILPCTSDEYPRPAPRPKNSRLDKAAFRAAKLPPMPDWREELNRFLTDFPTG